MYEPNSRMFMLHKDGEKWVISLVRIAPGTNPSTKSGSVNVRIEEGRPLNDVPKKMLFKRDGLFFEDTLIPRFWIHKTGDMAELKEIYSDDTGKHAMLINYTRMANKREMFLTVEIRYSDLIKEYLSPISK